MRYLPTDSSFWVTLITVIWNQYHKGAQSILYLADVCEPGCNLCFLIQHWQLGSSVLSKSSPSFCIPYPPSPTLLRSLYTTFFLFPLYLLTLSKGFILPEYKYTEESSILKNHPPSLLLLPVHSLLFLSWRVTWMNEYPSLPPSLPHLPFATVPRTIGAAVTNLSGETFYVMKAFLTSPSSSTSHLSFGSIPPSLGSNCNFSPPLLWNLPPIL